MTRVSPFGREFCYESPRFTFPGDEAVGQEPYSRCLDNWYVGILPDLEVGATAHGVTLAPESHERARRMLTGQFWLDDLIDHDPGDNATNASFERVVRSLPEGGTSVNLPSSSRSELNTAVTLVKNSIRSLPPQTQERIVEGRIEIQELTAQQNNTQSIKTYIERRRREGMISGRLVADSLGSMRGEGRNGYGLWLENVVAFLSLLDHTVDLRRDHARGRTLVAQTKLHQADLAVAGVSSLPRTLTTRPGRTATRRTFGHPIHASRAYFRMRSEAV